MGINCAPLVADMFLFCYEGDFMTSLSDDNKADIIEALNSTSRYLDDLLIMKSLFQLQLDNANTSDTVAPFFGFTSIYF